MFRKSDFSALLAAGMDQLDQAIFLTILSCFNDKRTHTNPTIFTLDVMMRVQERV